MVDANPPKLPAASLDLANRLLAVEERFRLFMENVREYAVFMMDPEGRVVDLNLGAEHLLGYGPEIVGQPFSIFFPPDDVQNGVPAQELRRAVDTGQASDDRWHVRKDGTYFWALGITTTMRDADGALKGFTKVLRDSTERKRFEEQLAESNRALQEAGRRKDEFLAVLAHELRNPLAPIFNALSILEDDRLPPPALRDARNVIARQVRSLARLIDDLLDVSRITLGKIQLRRTTVDLHEVVQNALQTTTALFEARLQTLHVSLPTAPLHVDGDKTRLEQVLVNLLSNAAKYGGEGTVIELGMTRDHGTVVLRVKDPGVGIAPDVLPRVFDLFTQIDASLERSQGGLGVGLALVKRLVEMHDGSVEALSDGLGKGAEFSVRLPILPESNVAVPLEKQIEAPRAAAVPLRILVVDDNIDAANSLELVLKLSGHTVVSAFSGTETLEAVRSQRLDVIFLDIAMPGLNGYQIAERLRSSPETKDIILIATTGYGQDEDRQRAIQSGFDHHLVKPVEFKVVEELLASVAQRLGKPQSQQS
jgi:PAS domain S-box-containing protein